jgi:hypothetical protein
LTVSKPVAGLDAVGKIVTGAVDGFGAVVLVTGIGVGGGGAVTLELATDGEIVAGAVDDGALDGASLV